MGAEQSSMKNVARRSFAISAPAASHARTNAAERLYMALGGSRSRENKGPAKSHAENEANGCGEQVTAGDASFADRAGCARLPALGLACRTQDASGLRHARAARNFFESNGARSPFP